MRITRNNRGGFALPTVLIASVVMLMVLAISVSSVATIRTALKEQHYEQLAKIAGEAGVAYAKSCLAQSGNVPLWTDAKPLTPATDCAGNVVLSPSVQIMVVAGGGGGGGNTTNVTAKAAGGGGGGGTVFIDDAFSVTPTQYNITVGNGGAGGTAGSGANGGASGISWSGGSLSMPGGGGGGGITSSNTVAAAQNGGSGGGGAGMQVAPGTPAQGGNALFAGQLGFWGSVGGQGSSSGTAGNGGGGGGAGSPGGAASGENSGEGSSGSGGAGRLSYISGEEGYYGAGGSGGRWGAGQVGLPGRLQGGIGGNNNGVAGSNGGVNTGAGGGGGAATGGKGGNGGSGVVMIRIPRPGTPGANISVSSASGATIIDNGAYRIYKYTSGSGTFTVSAASSGTCPNDPRCSVTTEQNLRSSFSIKRPIMNSEGKAVAVPNTGYVELLRASNGAVWRTYRQPSVQAAVVPDFCSASTQSDLGWSYVAQTTAQRSIPGASGNGAKTISLQSDGNTLPGQIYYRKDFVVTTPGMYNLRALFSASVSTAEFYINGNLIATAKGSGAYGGSSSDNVVGVANLSPGCHTIMARITNGYITSTDTSFTASLALQNGAPIVATDTTWRVTSGSAVHFSDSDYYTGTDAWTPVIGFNATSQSTRGGDAAEQTIAGWNSATGDPYAKTLQGCGDVGTVANDCTGSEGYNYLRSNEDFVLTTETEVVISGACMKTCDVYTGGNKILSIPASVTTVQQQTISLPAGSYRLATRVYSEPTAPPIVGYVALSLKRKTDNLVLARTDYSWKVSQPGVALRDPDEVYSYEASFAPSPNMFPPTFDAVVVGGGGGGGVNAAGGGGGGGVLSLKAVDATPSSRTVTIGGGGAGAPSTASKGTDGSSTIFGTYTVLGGGGGASRDNGPAPGSLGTGGGGSGTTAAGSGVRNVGGLGTLGIGWAGGYGTPADQGVASKGGGGGGASGPGIAATNTVAGNGGPGYIMYVGSTRRAVAGGGGGGVTASNGTVGTATDGGTNGSIGTVTNASANSGGGGGGGGGPAGGNGGSGIVVVRYRTAAFASAGLVATGGTKTVYGEYTYHTFTANGTFTITGS